MCPKWIVLKYIGTSIFLKKHQYVTFLFSTVRPVIIIDVVIIFLVTLRLVVSVVAGDYPATGKNKAWHTQWLNIIQKKQNNNYTLALEK